MDAGLADARGRLMLVDFDWGGEVGKACYPHARLCYELTDGRDGGDPAITKEDDRRVLHNAFEDLKRIVAGTYIPLQQDPLYWARHLCT
jgi:hypothetical protein